MHSEYQHFVEKCKKYNIKVIVLEDKFNKLHERFFEQGWSEQIDEMIDRCWANDIKQVNAMSIINRFKFAKEFREKDARNKEEKEQKEAENSEAKMVERAKRKDEIARDKARVGEFEEPEDCKTPPDVLNWIAENKQLIPRMFKREMYREKAEHPFSRTLSYEMVKGLAKARLITLIKQNIK